MQWLGLVFLLISAIEAANVTCSGKENPTDNPCFADPPLHMCPDGFGCIVDDSDDDNSFCCAFENMQSLQTTLKPTLPTASPSKSCKDLLNPSTGVSDCPARVSYCNDPVYYDLMTKQCPKTCNRCGGGGGVSTLSPSGGCADLLNPLTGQSDCPSRKEYCTNPAYVPLMKQQCRKTCDFC